MTEWTATPPSESGFYWVRDNEGSNGIMERDEHGWWRMGIESSYDLVRDPHVFGFTIEDLVRAGFQFWPEAIPPPQVSP